MDKLDDKSTNISIIWIAVVFLVLGTLVLVARESVDSELKHLHHGLQKVELALSNSYRALYLIESETLHHDDSKKEELKETHETLLRDLDYLRRSESNGIFFSKPFREHYYDVEWRFDELLSHFLLLSEKWQAISPSQESDRQLIVDEITKHAKRLPKINVVLIPAIKDEIALIESYARYANYIVYLFFMVFIFCGYFTVYVPWSDQTASLVKENSILADSLSRFEQRGNTFFWELTLEDMSLRRSRHLTGLLEGEASDRVISLNDELKFFTTNSRQIFLQAIDAAIDKKESLNIDIQLYSSSQREYWFRYMIHYDDTLSERMVGVVKDITEMRRSEIRFDSFFEQAPFPLVLLLEDNIKTINKSAMRYLDIPKENNLIGAHYSLLFPLVQKDDKSSLKKVEELSERSYMTKKAVRDHLTFRSKEGVVVTSLVEVISIPYLSQSGTIISIIDDSHRLNLERRLIEANRKSLHERKKKVEYTSHYYAILHQLTELINKNIAAGDKISAHREKIQKKMKEICFRIEDLWQENLSHTVVNRNNLFLIEDRVFFEQIQKRLNRKSLRYEANLEFFFNDSYDENYEENSFYWLDLGKVKVVINHLVYTVLEREGNNDVQVYIDFENINPKLAVFHFKMIDKLGTFDISDDVSLRDKRVRLVTEVTDYLQGDLTHKVNEDGSRVTSFSIDIERSAKYLENDKGEMFIVGEERFAHRQTDQRKISLEDLWEHLGDNEDLIRTLLKDFIDYYPVAVADMMIAIKDKDGEMLESLASDLYGVISYFPYFNSIERVLLIKKYGQFNRFHRAEEELFDLITELRTFESYVEDILLNLKRVA